MSIPVFPIPAADLLPHRPPMLLLGELTAHRPGFTQATALVTPEHPFVDAEGTLDPATYVEMLAQTAAAMRGYEARLAGGPIKAGYLVGIADFSIRAPARVGDALRLEVHQQFAMEQAFLIEGSIWRGADCLASGTLKLWEEKELPAHPGQAGGPAEPAQPQPQPLAPAFAPPSLLLARRDPIHQALCAGLESVERSEEENWIVGNFFFRDDFPGFQGHFPGYPLLAGMIMLKLAAAMGELLTDVPLELVTIEKAKISRQVFPGQRVQAEVSMKPAEGALQFRARLNNGPERIAIFNFLARKRNAECGLRSAGK